MKEDVTGKRDFEEFLEEICLSTWRDVYRFIYYQVENKEEAEMTVAYDLTVEEATQKQVDAGHSPWRLDPAYVSQVFVSLLISPEGIVGDYPIAYDDIEITENNGITAIASIKDNKSTAKAVYLKRLVRTDESGIWTVIGYDKVEK